jgi:hypothetical protein
MVSPKDNKKNQPSIPFKNVEDNRAHWIAEGKKKKGAGSSIFEAQSEPVLLGVQKEELRKREEEEFTVPYEPFSIETVMDEHGFEEQMGQIHNTWLDSQLKKEIPTGLLEQNEEQVSVFLRDKYGDKFLIEQAGGLSNRISITPRDGVTEGRVFQVGSYASAEKLAQDIRDFIRVNMPTVERQEAVVAEEVYRNLTIEEVQAERQKLNQRTSEIGLDPSVSPEGTKEMTDGFAVYDKKLGVLDRSYNENLALDKAEATIKKYISTTVSGISNELKKSPKENQDQLRADLRNTIGNIDPMYMEAMNASISDEISSYNSLNDEFDKRKTDLENRIKKSGITEELKVEIRELESLAKLSRYK